MLVASAPGLVAGGSRNPGYALAAADEAEADAETSVAKLVGSEHPGFPRLKRRPADCVGEAMLELCAEVGDGVKG